MSIATEISRLQSAKSDIKTAIEGKGVQVPSSTKIDGYAALVSQISQGTTEAEENDVNFYDYDGTRVASFTIAQAKALTQAEYNAILPPTHAGLTFQEWNWTLADIQSYNRRYIDIGANYVPTDGKTHIKVSVKAGETFAIAVRITTYQLTIEWGDGNEETASGNVVKSHTYSAAGKYEIVIDNNIGSDNAVWNFGGDNSLTYTQRMIEEMWFDGKVELSGYALMYVCAKVCLPLSCLPSIAASTFYAASVPMVAVPRGSNGIYSSSIFGMFNGKICLPKTMPSTSISATFSGYTGTRLIIPDQGSKDFNNAYMQQVTLMEIFSIPSNFGIATNGTLVFNYASRLRCMDIVQGWTPNNSLTFSTSTLWSPEDMVDFFTKLGTTTQTITLTFGTNNLNKLTADQKAIATNKGYTLA